MVSTTYLLAGLHDPESPRPVRAGEVPVRGPVAPGGLARRDLVDEDLLLDQQTPLHIIHADNWPPAAGTALKTELSKL